MGHQLEPGYFSICVLKTRLFEGERLQVVALCGCGLDRAPVGGAAKYRIRRPVLGAGVEAARVSTVTRFNGQHYAP